MMLHPGIDTPATAFAGTMQMVRCALYLKDLDRILQGDFPCKASENDAFSISMLDSRERWATLLEQEQEDGA